jgi:hypothetical protein
MTGLIPALAAGDSNSTTFTAVHTLTQTDIDVFGFVTILATATELHQSGTQ